jgi:Anti-sigma-K factor rskA
MPPKGHAELAHPQAADWVTGTLGPDDVVLFQFHLKGCPHCQAAVAEFGQLGQLLRQLPPAAEPPPALEARTIAGVLAAAAADRASARADGIAKIIRFPRWRSRTGLLTIASAVAAAVIAVLLVVPGLGAQKATFAFQLTPPRGSGPAASGSATARQDSSGSWNITLTVRHLKDVGPKRWYECWYVSRDGQVVSAGTFVVPSSGNGTFPMTSSADPRDFQSMEITIQSASKNGVLGHPIVLSGSAKKL